MDRKKGQKTAPVRPYNDTIWDRWSLYDDIPYVQDKSICSAENIAIISGNIVKAYRCLIKEPYKINHEQS